MKSLRIEAEETADYRSRSKRQRLVVKVGSSVLLREDEDNEAIDGVILDLATAVQTLVDGGFEVVLVSSGAIATGRARLGITEYEEEIPVLSAIGQSALTSMYEKAFQARGLLSAQILVTNDDVRDSCRLENFCKTLECSMREGVIAVINENDVVSHWTGTRPHAFSDNDMLAAIIAGALKADCLILLTDVDGVFTAHPTLPGAKLIRNLDDAPDNISTETSKHGRGGMLAKVRAVRYAVKHGCRKAVIANGRHRSALEKIVAGGEEGTIIYGGSNDA